eukprot:TRINITY_DN19773_c0_g1_i1.p1 TRINITY_DN19773_c0_g1~~TRINITY_DN19773_c0_g1_i1.p1  ORF type:complete len:184 (-),score=43.29 TRINITY_DN19773_c0_g1_i1:160-654(-)
MSEAIKSSTKWDIRFLEAATLFSTWSKDRSTGVGCCIVGPKKEIRSVGYNGFPRGLDDDVEERHQRPAKYTFTEHSERNAIYNACFTGTSLDGCTLYCTHAPCHDCARAIIQSGIRRVVVAAENTLRASWKESNTAADEMFSECGVIVDIVSMKPEGGEEKKKN